MFNEKKCSGCENYGEHKFKANVSTRKEIILINSTVDVFHNNYYTPSLEKFSFHLTHVKYWQQISVTSKLEKILRE